jgi:membrane protein implicated in regulation of membrane protease activity
MKTTTDDNAPDALAEDEHLRERFKLHTERMLNALFVMCMGFGALVGGALVLLVGSVWAQLALVWCASLVVYLGITKRAQAEARRDEIWREYLGRSFKGPRP